MDAWVVGFVTFLTTATIAMDAKMDFCGDFKIDITDLATAAAQM